MPDRYFDHRDQHVGAGWNANATLRWIEVGRLRLEEEKDGACALIQETPEATWLSATELAGLVQHLARWFADDPADAIRRIEVGAKHVKIELEAWDNRARIDEEHPPYDKLVQTLDDLLATCRHLREVGLLADRPVKTLPSRRWVLAAPLPPLTSSTPAPFPDLALLRDSSAKEHPAYAAFCRQLRGHAYGEEPLNQAWDYFKRGWEGSDAGDSK